MQRSLFFLYFSGLTLFAQDPLTFLGSGFRDPTVLRAPRGQIITIFLRNAKTIIPRAPTGSEYRIKASAVPVPSTLGGFSARAYAQDVSFPVPILTVAQREICGKLQRTPECLITGVTVQIPSEPRNRTTVQLVISEPGERSVSFPVALIEDAVHVQRFIDFADLSEIVTSGSPSTAVITHADGTLITAASPAKPGEVVVIYATGLGRTLPEVPSGAASPLPPTELNLSTSVISAPRRAIALQLDFHVNAGPARPYRDPARPITDYPVPEFLGLAPGQVGVYQINVRLPDRFPPVPRCMFESDAEAFGSVFSNLTIQIGAFDSIDGAQICVEPGTP